MLPISLTIQAIGSYPNKVTIPFEKLGRNNIYLISGQTGSGKTTIFDAICFALFNSASGSNRAVNTLRSHYAKSDVESFVEFKFLYKENIYSIWRSPSYERPKVRGEGTIIEKGKAILTLPDSKMIIGQKDVDNCLQELLGFDINQFSQVALLAQGEFLKLLNSDTQKRAEIFRNIFKTAPYKNFELNLKDCVSGYKNEYNLSKSSILQYLSQILTIDEEIKEEVEAFIKNQEFVLSDAFFDKILNQNISDKNDKKLLDDKIQENINKITELNLKIEQIKSKENLISECKSLDEKIILLNKNFEQVKLDFDSLNQKEIKKETLKDEIKNAKENYEKALLSIDLSKNLESLNLKIDDILKSIESCDNNLINTKKEHIISLMNDVNELINLSNAEKQKLIDLKLEYNSLNVLYSEKYSLFLGSQAGILAKNLVENSPCPVCGSTSHPNLAILSDDNISELEINNLKNNLDSKTIEMNALSQNCSVINEKINSKNEKLNSIKAQYNLEVEQNFEKVPAKIDFQDEINKLQAQKDRLNLEKIQFEKDILEIKSKISVLNLDSLDIDKYISEYESKTIELTELESEIQKISSDYQKSNIELREEISKKNVLNAQLEKLGNIDVNLKEELLKLVFDYSEQNEELVNKSQQIFSRLDNNEKLLKLIMEQNKKHLDLERDYSKYKNLYDCASGQLKGRPRIAFEQYIQGYYLDMVLYEANKRFKIISNGQYQLLRKKTADNLQYKSGLDIEVLDFHTFKKRSTKTLSGGESFKAALCLALGLSDCITQNQGGIRIDSLFIDEGFGSLDSENLELALDVIFNLGLNNRLIGIISHVEELKSKIQNKIITTKTSNGSSVEVLF